MISHRFLRTLPAAVLLLLVGTAVSLRADAIDQHIMRGIDQLYNVDFDGASASFDRAIAADPRDPAGYFYRANVHLWSYLFDRRREQLGQFMSYSDKTITVAEQRIAANPKDSRARLFLGMSYGYRAIAQAREENITAAAIAAKTCYERLNDARREDPKLYDASLGLGLFHFLFGSVPKAAQFMAGFTGIKGDAKLGIREIEEAAAKGRYFRNDAGMIMALLKIYYLDDVNAGSTTLKGLVDRYPRNVALLYALGTVYMDKAQFDRAIPIFESVIRLGNTDFKTFTEMSYGRLGILYYQRNDFPRAKAYLQSFLKTSGEKMFRTYSWYLLGVCYEIGGNREFAVKAYQKAAAGPRFSSPEDGAANRRAAELSKRPLTAADIDLIRAINQVSSGQNDGAITLATAVLGRGGLTPAQRAQAYFAQARGYQQKGDFKRAIPLFQSAIATGKHGETWVAPFSYFHMSECYRALGDTKRWQENIDRAKSFQDYDNERTLRFKIERDVTMID